MTGPLVPLRVRAHLSAGIAQAAPWGIALDGLLASELWAEHKASCRATGRDYVRAMELPEPPDLDLPLARCHHGGGVVALGCHLRAPRHRHRPAGRAHLDWSC